jgi:hypothetical protein
VLGEITSIIAAIITVPCVIALLSRRTPSRRSPGARPRCGTSPDHLELHLENVMRRKAK